VDFPLGNNWEKKPLNTPKMPFICATCPLTISNFFAAVAASPGCSRSSEKDSRSLGILGGWSGWVQLGANVLGQIKEAKRSKMSKE